MPQRILAAALAAFLPLALFTAFTSAGARSSEPAAKQKKDWTMSSYDVVASGHNTQEKQLGTDNVHTLEVKWLFDEEDAGHPVGPIHATPVVKGNKVFVGSNFGRFYALGPDGELLWEYETRQPNPLLAELVIPAPIGGPVTGAVATPVVGAAVLPRNHPYVIFADLDGNVYALRRGNGAEVWVLPQVDPHALGGVVGNSLLLVEDTVVIGFASIENVVPDDPSTGLPYECCDHRGFVVALDVVTGEEKWRYETIGLDEIGPAPAPFVRGPSGADIWGQPTYDVETHTVYIGTGQNFSPTADGNSTGTSDALIALDAETGEPRWITQLTEGDIWVSGIPNPDAEGNFVDQDVGDSPKIYRLPDGRKVVGAGQKSGEYHVLDATTGEVIVSTPHVQQANSLGGLQQGGAMADGLVYQHGLDGLGGILFNGSVMALSPDGTEQRWRFDKFFSPVVGGLAVANGVLYFQSPIEEPVPLFTPPEWALYALDARTGDLLSRIPFDGRGIASPVVSRGRIYVGKGNSAAAELGLDENGGVLCLGLPE